MPRPKVAIVVSHPIQHFCPQYVSLAENREWEIRVFFASDYGYKPYFDPSFGQRVSWSNIDLDSIPHEFLSSSESTGISSRTDAANLEFRLDTYKPDVLVVYGYTQKLQRRAIRYGFSHRIRILLCGDSESRAERPFYKKIAKKIILKRLFKRIDGFLTVGDANEQFYRHYGVPDHHMFRTSFPVDVRVLDAAFQRRHLLAAEFRRQHGIPENAVVISTVGKLLPGKNHAELIGALKILPPSVPITALIVGSGQEEEKLRTLAGERTGNTILFTGFVPCEKCGGIYATSDFYVHTSLADHHPLSVSEAIYMGCPVVISSKCGSYGPMDDVQNGFNGFVYETGNPLNLSDRIKRLAVNKLIRERFSRNSRKIAILNQQRAHHDGFHAALTGLDLL